AVAPALGGGLHHVLGAVQIGVDDGVPAFHGKIDGALRKLPSGAVDETIEAAVGGPDGVEQGADGSRLPYVGRVGGRRQAARRYFSDKHIELVAVAANDNDMRTQPRKQPCDGTADAARA